MCRPLPCSFRSILVYERPRTLHVREHLAKVPQVFHIEIPEVRRPVKRQLGGYEWAGVAGYFSQLRLEALAQVPRRLCIQCAIFYPSYARLGVLLDFSSTGGKMKVFPGVPSFFSLGFPKIFSKPRLLRTVSSPTSLGSATSLITLGSEESASSE